MPAKTIFNYTIYAMNNGEWKELSRWVRPFYDAETLDESLDHGKILLATTKRNKIIRPFTPIKIDIEETHNKDGSVVNHSIYRLASDTSINQRSFAADAFEELYDHVIGTVELTKLLERDICDSMTFTNKIAHDYAAGAGLLKPKWESTGGVPEDNVKNNMRYVSPVSYGATIFIESVAKGLESAVDGNLIGGKSKVKITFSDGTQKELSYYESFQINTGDYPIGFFKVVYDGDYVFQGNQHFPFTITYTFESVKAIPQKPLYTITEVINRILSAGVTRREGVEAQKYFLTKEMQEKYSTVLAPEFYITRSTLFEALLQVGGYIHAIPRLVWNEETNRPDTVTFDELGGSNELDFTNPLHGYDAELSMDDYCESLDSHVDNLLNSRDLVQGAVTEPSIEGWKSTRTEEGEVEISNDTAIIMLEHPAYRVTSLKFGIKVMPSPVPVLVEADLTPYLYEASEYGALSSYDDQYPYSKAYALTYSQGDKKITGLAFKLQDAISAAFQTPAIENILARNGVDLDSISNLKWYKNMSFQVTYIPIVSARLVQKKPYVGEFPEGNALIFNQSANTVESEFYGEHLKGNVAKMGNEISHRTYYFTRVEDIPKCGDLIDGQYVGVVEKEYQTHWIKATLTLTPNFNKLAEYFAINSNYRLYEVSERQSIERQINYGEDVIIGDAITSEPGKASITAEGLRVFQEVLLQRAPDGVKNKQISVAKCMGTDETQQQTLTPVALSAISIAAGNSLVFSCKYADNYSAGYSSRYYSSANQKNVQEQVPYGDVYGQIYYLKAKLGRKIKDYAVSDFQSTGKDANGLAFMLPEIPENLMTAESDYFDYATYPFIVQKDSRENLNLTTQLHFRANRKSIVLGTQLGQNNPHVTEINPEKRAKLYLLPYKLNMLQSILDLTGAAELPFGDGAVTLDTTNKTITIGSFENATGNTYQSWALVDPTNNRYYLGENLDLAPSAQSLPVVMTFKNN